VIIGGRLVEVRLVGVDLRLGLATGGLGLVESLASPGVAGEQVPGPLLLEPGQDQRRLVEFVLRRGDLFGLGLLGLLERGLGVVELGPGHVVSDLERLLIDHEEELVLLDRGLLVEVPFLEEPLDASPKLDGLLGLGGPGVLDVIGDVPPGWNLDGHFGRGRRGERNVLLTAADHRDHRQRRRGDHHRTFPMP
jgi:hypothetical protein